MSKAIKKLRIRSYFSIVLAIWAILNVLLRESPSKIWFEYPVIAVIVAVFDMPYIGTFVLSFLALILAKDKLARWVCGAAFLCGILSFGYVMLIAQPLQEAAGTGDMKNVKKYLSLGGNINVQDDFGYAPLHMAAHRNDTEITKFLIDAGADVNIKSGAGNTPLRLAGGNGAIECCKLLFENGASAELTGLYGSTAYTPLQAAAEKGHLEVVKYFLEKGVGPDEQRGTKSALLHARENGHEEIVHILLEAGATQE